MKYKELVDLDDKELEKNLLSLKREHFNFRAQTASNDIENKSRIVQIKENIARIKTFQNTKIKNFKS